MYVSTAKVLKRFAEKVAARRPFDMDKEETAAYEKSRADKATEAKTDKPAPAPAAEKTTHKGYSPGLDKLDRPLVSAKPAGPAVPPAGDKYKKMIDSVSRPRGIYDAVSDGLGNVVGGAKNIGGLMMEQPGIAALGAGTGASALYAISRLMQSEEERKKRQPIVAPALGAVGGAALAPLLASMLAHRNLNANIATTDQSPSRPGMSSHPTSNRPAQIGFA